MYHTVHYLGRQLEDIRWVSTLPAWQPTSCTPQYGLAALESMLLPHVSQQAHVWAMHAG